MTKKSHIPIIIVCVIVSLIIGAISGAVFSVVFNKYIEPRAADIFDISLFDNDDDPSSETRIVKVKEESATIEAVEKITPSVVSIVITKDLSKVNNNNFFPFNIPFFFSPPQVPEGPQEVGGGTGFIITDDGYIITNKHVVQDSEADYTVILNDGTKHDALVVATDIVNDIAVLKIEATDLPTVAIGDSDNLQIGQTVVAIGNALSEFHNTVTKGVVSGINRSIVAGDGAGFSEEIEGAIQTDAAINPGNSGGPLINLSGEVIGVNTAVSQQGQLVGFAIPINIAKKVVDDIKEFGKIMRPWLGVRYLIINEQFANANNLEVDYGALIIRGETSTELAVIPGSPADKAGLVENDIILEIDEEKITSEKTLAEIINNYQPNDEIKIKIYHKGDKKDITVKLGEAPSNGSKVEKEEIEE